MRLRNWIILAMASFILGLIIFLPARLLEGLANRALAPQAQLAIIDGSLWSGRGTLSLAGANIAAVPFRWRVDALALLRLRAGLHLQFDSAAIAGSTRLGVSFRSIEIRDTDLRLDAGLIGNFSSMAGLLGPAGSLQLRSAEGESVIANYRGPLLASGNFKLRAENLLLRSLAPRALGQYAVDVTLRDSAAEFRIGEASGPLKLDGGGSIRWSMPHQLSYRGIAAAPADAAELLAPLRMIGRPMADGRVQIDYQGGW